MDLLFELREETNVALVVVSHDPRLGRRFDRVVRLADGTIAADSSRRDRETAIE
jgi:predicted ABC-type transport system involved in lysophospholipase L1 biosynthesis ATPase subunit